MGFFTDRYWTIFNKTIPIGPSMIPAYAPHHTIMDLARSLGYLSEGKDPVRLTFERSIKALLGTEQYRTVSSGRFALYSALKMLGVKKGDEVIIPAFTPDIVPMVMNSSGAKIQLADVKLDDYTISLDSVLDTISTTSKGIVAVHTHGTPSELKGLKEICDDRRIFLLEDAASAFGARYQGRSVGTFGDAGVFSYGIGKSISMGTGGGITFSEEKNFKLFQDYYPLQGSSPGYKVGLKITGGIILSNSLLYPIIGQLVKNRIVSTQYDNLERELKERRDLPVLAYCLGIIELQKKFYNERIKNAAFYQSILEKYPSVFPPSCGRGTQPVYSRYFVRVESNAKQTSLCTRMRSLGIEPLVPDNGYPVSETYAGRIDPEKIPNSIKLSQSLIGLPIYKRIGEETLERIFSP